MSEDGGRQWAKKGAPHSDFSHRLNRGLIVAVGAVLVAGFLVVVSGVDGDIPVKWGTVPVM